MRTIYTEFTDTGIVLITLKASGKIHRTAYMGDDFPSPDSCCNIDDVVQFVDGGYDAESDSEHEFVDVHDGYGDFVHGQGDGI